MGNPEVLVSSQGGDVLDLDLGERGPRSEPQRPSDPRSEGQRQLDEHRGVLPAGFRPRSAKMADNRVLYERGGGKLLTRRSGRARGTVRLTRRRTRTGKPRGTVLSRSAWRTANHAASSPRHRAATRV